MKKFLAIVLTLSASPAWADSVGQWLETLSQPTTGVSCCDISDCKATSAEWKAGQWWADVQGEKTPIPAEKVIVKTPSPTGEAFVCAGYARRIYCFVPPLMAL